MNTGDTNVIRADVSRSRCDSLPVRQFGDSQLNGAREPPAAGARTELQVLWIDDEVHLDDPLLLIMKMDGIRAEVATTGQGGINLASAKAFNAILLDLRLPDMYGTAVLAALISAGVRAPVIILTGYGDIATCVAALRLGAKDFKEKPISDVELVPLIRALCQGPRPPAGSSSPRPRPDSSAPHPTWRAMAADVAAALLDPCLTHHQFLALAAALRRTHSAPGFVPSGGDEPGADTAVPAMLAVNRIASVVECELKSRRLPTQRDVADGLGIHDRAAWRDLTRRTSWSYRTLRMALRLRPTLNALAEQDEHIRQIAYSIGYEFGGQYARDFRHVFGLPPRCFRQLVRFGRRTGFVS